MLIRCVQIILFVVMTVPVFCQGFTFKKQKRQLLQEQEVLVSALNSQRANYLLLKDSFDTLLVQGYELTTRSYELYGRLRLMNHRIYETSEQLSHLGLLNYRDKIKTDTISLERESHFETAFLNEKKAYKKSDIQLEQIVTPDLTDLSHKQQLAVLESWNSSAKDQLEKEAALLESMEGHMARVHQIIVELQNQMELFPAREKRYSEVSDVLYAQLNAERENYARNGPEGFDYRYKIIFPEVSFSNNSFASEDLFEMASAGAQFSENLPDTVLPSPQKKVDGEIYDFVDEAPSFQGNVKFYLKENLVYPEFALEYGLEGKCYVSFIVSSVGTISDVHVVRGVPDCKECDAEAMRLVENMPKWNPGKIDGRPVNCKFNLPVTFKMD